MEKIARLVCLIAASTQFYDWEPGASPPRAMTVDEWAERVVARQRALLRVLGYCA